MRRQIVKNALTLLLILVVASGYAQSDANTVTIQSLLNEMIDREAVEWTEH